MSMPSLKINETAVIKRRYMSLELEGTGISFLDSLVN